MTNMQDLLGALLQNGPSNSSRQRMEHALGERGLGRPDGFLGQLLGGGPGGAGAGRGDMLGNLANMAQSMLQDTHRAVKGNNPAAIGGLGALAGALLGGGGGSVKGAVGGGAMAMLASLAIDAFQNRQRPPTGGVTPHPSTDKPAYSTVDMPLGLRAPTNPSEEKELESQAALILKAMINAAKADGQIDETEMQRIVGKLNEQGADGEAQDFVRDEMRRPIDLESIIRAAPSPQVAVEVYAASLLAIEVDTPAEKDYLRRLAQGLGLNDQVVQRLHTLLGVA